MYPSIYFESFWGYLNEFNIRWSKNSPEFKGLLVTHIVEFLKQIQNVGAGDENVQLKLFILSLSFGIQDWIKICCKPKGISFLKDPISRFLEFWKPQCQTYEDILRELVATLKREGFFSEIIIRDLREAHHAQEEESVVDKEFINEKLPCLEHALDESGPRNGPCGSRRGPHLPYCTGHLSTS